MDAHLTAPDKAALIESLRPLIERVRTDVTAVKGAQGNQVWTSEPLTDERLARHVNGGPARGVAPIKPGESVTMVALLDFDSHKGETGWDEMAATAAKVFSALDLAWGCNPVAFRSSGGRGVHVFLLWAEPQDARSVRLWLAGLLGDCGLKPGTGGVGRGEVEIFPRQNSVRPGGYGNQFILPLAGRGALLTYEDLADTLVPAADVGVAPSPAMWRDSPAVPLAPPPATVQAERPQAVGNLSEAELAHVWSALDAIPNAGTQIPYDEWRDIGFALHWATGGSAEGLERAEAWSARSAKHVPGYLQAKVWEFADRNAGTRDTVVITSARLFNIAERYGWRHPERNYPDAADFTPLPAVEVRAPAPPPDGEAAAGGDPFARPAGERRGVPAAKHLTTDQANAGRIVATYGTRVLVAADRWHVWDGARWAADEAGVYRYACHLSAIVKDEAKAWESKNQDVAQALKKWGARCEMKGTIEAAVGLARKMLTVDVETLDADPWLFNVRNGVVDLRTGRLGKHDPALMMTKMANADYLGLDAPSSGVWERTVLEIVGGDQRVADFLRRWFGYCCTGLTQEQVFVVHWGDGANGKSTVLDTVTRVLGDYAATAAPGLMAAGRAGGDRHPTEIAMLCGRRMVTAHETADGVHLREDFVKQATGSDRLQGRYMRQDFFEFTPTHKLQLLTNSKPTVRGQDHGIWRRVRLVPYTQRFGTAEDVAAKRATRVRDTGISEALGTEQVLSEVLAWLVRGAVEWHAGGLQEPSLVVEASEAYRVEQDRVLQFLRECCELDLTGDKDWSEPLTQGMGGLYPAYVSWVKDTGGHPLSRQKFMAELQRAHPRAETFDAWGKNDTGARRRVIRVRGLRLLAE